MSNGKINKILDFTKKYLEKKPNIKSETEYYNLLNECYSTGREIFPELTLSLMNEVFTILFKKEFVKTLDTDKCYFPDYLDLYSSVKIPKEFQILEDHFQKLKALPQPEQRTKEWFEYRHNRITASDTAAAIDENPYEPVESFILKKCDPNHQFLDNANVYHGKKFELIATKIYEHIYNVQVFEFGALPSETHAFLGASPDGICSAKTLDNKFSDRLGTMLEIKCVAPNGRTIETSGRIPGHICPYYYYLQVQQQLECCELQTCDFWQCKLIEYKSREEYLIDQCKNTQHTIGINAQKIKIDDRIKKGVLLQFFPKKWEPQFAEDNIEWKSKFIYPPRLDMTSQQYDDWIVKTMSELNQKHPDIIKDYTFNKVIYWKLEQSHNQAIERDKKLFASLLPILKQTWEKVKYYREHLDELPKLKEIVDRRKKYIKTDTDFMLNNDLIRNKVLFLDDFKQSKTKKEVVPKNLKNHVDCDFVDDDEDTCDFIDDEPVVTKTSTKQPKQQIINKTVDKSQDKPKFDIKKVKTTKKKEESDKEDDGEYKKIPKTNFINKLPVKKNEDYDCEFID
jgi:putative phage-type endonuclease